MAREARCNRPGPGRLQLEVWPPAVASEKGKAGVAGADNHGLGHGELDGHRVDGFLREGQRGGEVAGRVLAEAARGNCACASGEREEREHDGDPRRLSGVAGKRAEEGAAAREGAVGVQISGLVVRAPRRRGGRGAALRWRRERRARRGREADRDGDGGEAFTSVR